MRNGQNKRMRGRNRKGQNPLTRVYESNGPDVKIRGTASHVADKYVQLARDAQASGDPVAAENYYQHAEHYYRLIAAAQEQFRQQNPYYRPENERGDDSEGADEDMGGEQPAFGTREPQPYLPRDAQPFVPRDRQSQPHQRGGAEGEEIGGLPSFITGGQPQGEAPAPRPSNGHDGQPDRFPLHRRRRRHRGPRGDAPGAQEASDESSVAD